VPSAIPNYKNKISILSMVKIDKIYDINGKLLIEKDFTPIPTTEYNYKT
jgi:hypothetical protein